MGTLRLRERPYCRCVTGTVTRRVLQTPFFGHTAWWVPALLAVVGMTCAQDGVRPDDARSFVVSPPDAARRWIDVAASANEAVPGNPALGAGYHVIELPGWDPPLPYVVVIPVSPAPAAGRPLLMAREPTWRLPPDELPVRGLYAGFLEAGWVVLVPVPSRQMGGELDPGTMTGRDVWYATGIDLLPCLIADVASRTAIDRERVVVMAPLSENWRTPAVDWPVLETTPFAAIYVPLFGGATIHPPKDPGRFAGRVALFHTSPHAPDVTRLLLGRLRNHAPPIPTRWRNDPQLNYLGEIRLTAEAVQALTGDLRRLAPPDTFDILVGRGHPARHEWFEIRGNEEPMRLRAARQGGRVVFTTPDDPGRQPIPMTLYWAHTPERVDVRFNGHIIATELPAAAPGESLRLERYRRQTGRPATRLLDID
jgi:hypothetical protein